MRGVFSVTLVLLLALLASIEANKKSRNHQGTGTKSRQGSRASECSSAEIVYGKCIPESGDCGSGFRDATCKDRTDKIPCKIPCNWKKDISDCKYKFTHWGECDSVSNTKSRSGTLKRAMFNADCQSTVKVSKPCSAKTKKTRGEKKKTS